MSHLEKRHTWRRQAVIGAVLLAGVSAPASQAVMSAPRERASSSPTILAADPVDTSQFAVSLDPWSYDPLRTKADLLAGYRAESAVTPIVPVRDATVIRESRSERVDEVSANTHYNVPRAALTAYRTAAIVMNKTDPDCRVPWSLLAAIGQVESDQGRYGGSHVLADGSTSPHILGLALNGKGNVASIPDTDGGRLDGDTVWDRAVGPMQFIPSTWAIVGVDGDGDGVRDPHDFDDAALAAAVYLCSGDRDLSTAAGASAAVYSYNHSSDYVSLVLSIAKRYDAGAIDVVPNDTEPGTPNPVPGGDQPNPGRPNAGPAHEPRPHGGGPAPEPGPGPKPDPGPDPGPGPKPDPGPDPIPEPKPTELTGVLDVCVDVDKPAPTTWCLQTGDETVTLDFGELADFTLVQGDYDADGTAESVADELAGLAGTEVVVRLDDDAVVEQLNGVDYVIVPSPEDGAPAADDGAPAADDAPADPAATP